MKEINSKELEKKFDNGESILAHIDKATVKVNPPIKSIKQKVNVDIPIFFINELDKYASMFGMTRQAVIKSWLIEQWKINKKELL
jgi:hypothetical protein